MSDTKLQMLKDKIDDYRRFAFITIALTAFLVLGTVLPNETVHTSHQSGLLITIGVMLVMAIFFHRTSIRAQRLLAEEE
ncbi:hypothetical protein CR203_00680 [Salipaludibacillus neizhouensis]|uniref:YrhC-like protein n=1 Tax=Salipaludibacillus neizhouensis TaxID=885475 RepID=A0A3A9KGB1_9BACI|nr:YrhC family protein [Salipaludibacillus neizhouensis]RKL68603.1 hypothetical protein CR203_00680 [Salipaludibacillus neizhouensis]